MRQAMRKRVSIVTPCYNEEANVGPLHLAVKTVMATLSYDYEHLFIDNDSRDTTQSVLTEIAKQDPNVRVIFNARNFGHIRSPYYGILQASGDAVITLVADFQDPPEMIPELLKAWDQGSKVVVCVKRKSKENPLMFFLRKVYYRLMSRTSSIDHIENFTGFGLYDRKFVEVLRQIDDPYPYFRGIVAEYAFQKKVIEYTQPQRLHGKTKNNFYSLFDIALLGMVNHTKIPLRLLTLSGLVLSLVTFFLGVFYLVQKLIYWDTLQMGVAPMLIGIFFLGSVQMLFMGIIGEYIGAIYTQVKKRPRVVEKERLNFENDKNGN